MAKLYRNGFYFYMNEHPELYGWNTLYADHECTKELKSIYGKEFYESGYAKMPPILFRQDAVKNVVDANLYRNELRYMLWEIDKATQSGKYDFEIKLDFPLDKESLNCIKLLGYKIELLVHEVIPNGIIYRISL